MANITEDKVENEWVKRLKIKQEQDAAVEKALKANKAAGLLKIRNDKSKQIASRKSNLNEDTQGPYKPFDKTNPEHPDYIDPSKIPGEIYQPTIPGLDVPTASTPQDHPRYPNSPFYNTPNELKGVSPWIKDELQIRKGKEIFKLNTGIPLAHHMFTEPTRDQLIQEVISNPELNKSDYERILGPDYETEIEEWKKRREQKNIGSNLKIRTA